MLTPKSDDPPRQRDALPVAVIYAAFGGLWILLSDKTVEMLFRDPDAILVASTLKGWLFIGVTALLLFILLRRGAAPNPKVRPGGTASIALPLLLLALGIAVLVGFGIAHTLRHQREVEVSRLQAVAKLKVRQIADWLTERRRDTEFVESSTHYANELRRWLAGDARARDYLTERIDTFRANRGFGIAVLLDPEGAFLWSSDGTAAELAPPLRKAAREAAGSRNAVRVGPYRDERGEPHLDFVVPLVASGDEKPGVVVLHVDPGAWLYPTLQDWPLPSDSGEALLFRRDGDDVLFLNQLRFRKDSAVRLRLPVSSPELLAAQALHGTVEDGATLSGVDYRDTPVLGVVRAVPGTDWFLIAKLDRDELYAQAIKDVTWIGFAGLLALFLTGVALVLLGQRGRLAFSEAARRAQEERLQALQLLEAIAAGSEDAIFAQDQEGRFTLFNRSCERITGRSAAEVLGNDEAMLFPAAVAARQIETNRRVIERGENEVFEERVPLAAGEAVFLTTKGPLRDEQGRVVGMFGISRDITARKRAEDELQARNAELERFNRASVGRELDMIALKERINALERELGRTPSFPLNFDGGAGSPTD